MSFSKALESVNAKLVEKKGKVTKSEIIETLTLALLDDIALHKTHKERHGWGPYFYGMHAMTANFEIDPNKFILCVSTSVYLPNGDLNRNTINRYRQKTLQKLKPKQ